MYTPWGYIPGGITGENYVPACFGELYSKVGGLIFGISLYMEFCHLRLVEKYLDFLFSIAFGNCLVKL